MRCCFTGGGGGGGLKLICLIYTDDLIVDSQSERGLRNCLSKFETYNEHWCLDINKNKTKSKVFNKSRKCLPFTFHINDNSIENVKKYKYLGIFFFQLWVHILKRKQTYKEGINGIIQA